MRDLVIRGTSVPTDENGLVHLNTLHRLSKAPKHNIPSKWTALEGTKKLVAEAEQNPNLGFGVLSTARGGSNSGIYAHPLLAVAYAAWISPSFQLEVSAVFLAYKAGTLNAAEVLPPKKPYSEWSTEEKKVNITIVNSYGKHIGAEAAQWFMWEEGFPKPPAHLMPKEMQLSFFNRVN